MKIYTISLFLILYALALESFGASGLFDASFSAYQINESDISSMVPDTTYSSSDVGVFSFGDFPKMLVTLGKVFLFAPAIASYSLNSLGAPGFIVVLVMVPLYIAYVVGLAQILGRFSIRDSE